MYVQFVDFKNNHILNRILEKYPFIQYPISQNYKKEHKLQCVQHYFDLDLFRLAFQNKIYYVFNKPEQVIRLTNHYLRKKHKENMAIFERLNAELRSFNGDNTDTEYDILQKRYNSARQAVIEHKYLSEPFETVEFPVSLDELIPNRILLE